MLKIKQFAFNFFEENTYLVWDSDSLLAIVIDPGMLFDKEVLMFDNEVQQLGLKINLVVQTHLHLDHCFGANHIAQKYSVDIAAHPDDAVFGKTIADQCARFGIRADIQPVQISRPLHHGDIITVGNFALEVRHLPGHSPGGLAFFSKEANTVFSGDSLFKQSIGRTDLLGGDLTQLLQSIQTQLFTLPQNTTVLPGHGPSTTIISEINSNPYL